MAGNPYDMKAANAAAPFGGDEAGAGPKPEGREPGQGPRPNAYKRQMIRANIFLAGLFVAGAVTLYALSFREGPAEASAEQRTVDAMVDAMILQLNHRQLQPGTPGPGQLTRDLLQNFHRQMIDRQVPTADLRKNPFYFVAPPTPEAEPAAQESAAPEPEVVAEAPRISEGQVQAELKSLTLQSVMMGRDGRGAAIICNNLVTAGQRIKCFAIKKINPSSVVLTCEGKDYVLNME